jgi:hypothetical protein
MQNDAIEKLWRQHFANWSITSKGVPTHILERRLRLRLAWGRLLIGQLRRTILYK